jgi:hypothetical protein
MIHAAREDELAPYGSFWRQTSRVLVLSGWGAEFLALCTVGTYAVVTLVDSGAKEFGVARM